MADDRIEILIEAENKASATIKTVVNDLKGVKAAATEATSGLAGAGDAINKSLTSASATISKVTKELSKPLKSSMVVTTVSEDPSFAKAKELLTKPLKSSMVVTTTVDDGSTKAAKAYQDANKYRILGNDEARASEKALAAQIESRGKAEVATAKQAAAEYKKYDDFRKEGNRTAWDKYSADQATAQVASAKAAAAEAKGLAKAQADAAKEAAKQAKEAEKATQGYGGTLSGLTGLVERVFASYLVYKFAASLKDATSAVLEWMGSMETYGIAIASSLQVGGNYVEKTSGRVLEGAEAFKIAQRDAVGVIEALQVANFQTVASLDQLIRMYQEALPIAMSKGFDKKMVQDFTLSVTQAASAMGVSMDMMAEEARSLLTGAINLRNSRVAVALGITPEDIRRNSADANQLFTFLMGKLKVYSQAGEELQNSWRGLWSNFKDVMMQAGGKALEPLFQGIKQQLKEIVENIVTLDKEAGKIIWNPAFLDGINTIKAGIVQMMNTWTAFSASVEGSGLGKALMVPLKILGAGADFVNDPGGTVSKYTGSYNPTTGGVNLPDWIKNLSPTNSGKSELMAAFKEVQAQKDIAIREWSKSFEGGATEADYVNVFIQKYAKKYDVPAPEIAALLKTEGGGGYKYAFNPEGGGTGALGYGQIRQPAIQQLKQLGNDYTLADIMDPETNIKATVQYYKYLKDRFQSSELAYKAYNQGEGFVAAHFSDKPMKDDAKKWATAQQYSQDASGYEKDTITKGIFGKTPTTDFVQKKQLTQNQKDEWDRIQTENINAIKRTEQEKVDAAKFAGDQEKALDLVNIRSKEERQKFNLEVDERTIKAQIKAKEEYLAQYSLITDEFSKIGTEDGGTGIFKDIKDKTEAEEKSKTVKTKVAREIASLKSQLIVTGAQEEEKVREKQQKDLESDYAARVKLAENEYNDLKKINDLEVLFNRKTDVQAFEEEEEARKRLIRVKLEEIAVQLQAQNLGDKEIGLRAKQADLIDEFEKTELTAGERKKKQLADDAKAQQQLQEIIAARITYNTLIANPDVVEGLEREAAISKVVYQANEAQAKGLDALAAAYRDIAEVMQASSNRGDFWGGITDGLDEVVNSIGSTRSQIARLTSGIGGDMKSTTSDLFYNVLKGNMNWDKERQVYDAGKKLEDINAQKEQIKLQQEQISGNKDLSSSEKETARISLDAKLKQLEAEEKLIEAQKQAAENSKGAGELWQGFLDSITKKITDFMADSLIQDFFGFLSGNVKEGTKSGGGNIFGKFFDWIAGAKKEVQSGMGAMVDIVGDGLGDISGVIDSSGSGISNSFSGIFSKMANAASEWMKTIYNYVVDYLKQLAASIASSGFGNFFGGGSTSPDVGDVGDVGGDIGYWHKGGMVKYHGGGLVLRYHGGGLARDEVPIVAKKGEYVLSKDDVDFVKKVKGGGPSINVNIQGGAAQTPAPTVVPLGMTVMVDNASSILLQASSKTRKVSDEQYIIDVVLKDINSRGRLGKLGR